VLHLYIKPPPGRYRLVWFVLVLLVLTLHFLLCGR